MQESTSPSSSPSPSPSPSPFPFVNVMDNQEKQESFSPTPLLPRLDRLDRLLQLLEENHNLSSGRHNNNNRGVEKDDDKLFLVKSVSSALEEVKLKGNLIQRLAMLETRVLQLSLAIDEGDLSKSSPSTVERGYEKLHHGYDDESSLKEKERQKRYEDDFQLLYGQPTKTPLPLQHSVCELRKKYEQFVGSTGSRNKTRQRHGNNTAGSTKWKKTKQEGAQQVATMV